MYAVTINKIITNIHVYKMYQCSEYVFTDVLVERTCCSPLANHIGGLCPLRASAEVSD